ncbi:TIGR01244 family protein [Rhodobacterales bacterium 52_120_T64]|nr:TIGR01244 family protein [Rhodobacterales bacterium 52_120_T64]
MQVSKVTDEFSICGQISASDVALIKATGFRTIVCNRPDDEEYGQPAAEIIKKAAEDLDMKFYYLPLGRTGISSELLEDFRNVVNGKNGPVFAYCRTGARCGMLWDASQS